MDVASLERIEADIRPLTLDEQVWLMERLARSIREQTQRQEPAAESELVRMAADPEIQRELRLLEAETEASLVRDWLGASLPALMEVWDNEEDAVYDDL